MFIGAGFTNVGRCSRCKRETATRVERASGARGKRKSERSAGTKIERGGLSERAWQNSGARAERGAGTERRESAQNYTVELTDFISY